MPVAVARQVLARPVFGVGQRSLDLRGGRLRTRIVDIDVGHDDIGPIALRCPGILGIRLAGRAHHDHAGTEAKLGVGYCIVLARDHELLLEAEGLVQPLDRPRRILVAEAGKDVGNTGRFFCNDFLRSSQETMATAKTPAAGSLG